jgi:hypothetical protein
MISVTFTADNITSLRKEIAEFIGQEKVAIKLVDMDEKFIDPYLARGIAHESEQPVTAPLAPAPTVEETAPTPVETQTEQPTDSASDASPPSNDIDPDLVRATTLRLASLRGRDAVMEVLKPYNVARSSEVPRDLWPQLIADLEAAQNG